MTILLSTVKTQLGITGDSEDARLRLFLPQAISIAESYCNRKFCKQTVTEFYDGNGTHDLVLRNVPIVSITNLWEDIDRSFGASSLLVDGTDFVYNANSGVVTRINAYWPYSLQRGRVPVRGLGGYMSYGSQQLVALDQKYTKCIKIEYETGWDAVPMDIQYAVGSLVACMMREASVGAPLASESLDYYSYQLASSGDTDGQLTSITAILKNYVINVI